MVAKKFGTLFVSVGLLVALASCGGSRVASQKEFSVQMPSEVAAAFPALRIFQVIQDRETLFLGGSSGKSAVLLSWSAHSGSEVLVSHQQFPEGLVPGTFDIVAGDVYFLFFRAPEGSSEVGPSRQVLRWTGDGWKPIDALGPWLKRAMNFVDSDEESLIRLIGTKGEVVRWQEEDAGVVDIVEDGEGLRALIEQGGLARNIMKSGDEWFAVFDKVVVGGLIGEVETPSGEWGQHETSTVASVWRKHEGREWTMLYEVSEGEQLLAAHAVGGELYILLSGIKSSYSTEISGVATHFIGLTTLKERDQPLQADAGFVFRSADPLIWVQEGNQVEIYKVLAE